MTCSIRDSLGFAVTCTPVATFFSSSISHRQSQSFDFLMARKYFQHWLMTWGALSKQYPIDFFHMFFNCSSLSIYLVSANSSLLLFRIDFASSSYKYSVMLFSSKVFIISSMSITTHMSFLLILVQFLIVFSILKLK